MALIARLTTWSAGDKLTATALNNEHENVVDALDGTDQVNLKTKYNAADLPTYQLINSHASGYALQAGDGTTNDLFGVKSTGVIESKVATGTAPLIVASTTLVSNLNADQLDGYEAAGLLRLDQDSAVWQASSTALQFDLRSFGNTDVTLRLAPNSALGDYWDLLLDASENGIVFSHYDSGSTFTGEYLGIGYRFLSGREALVEIGGSTPDANLGGSILRLHGSATEYQEIVSTDNIFYHVDHANGTMYSIDGSTSVITTAAELKTAGNLNITGNNQATIQTLTDAASITWDCDNGSCAKVTLGGNRTLANLTNPNVGATYQLIVKQDGTGSRTLAWGAYYKHVGGSAPTITITPGATDIITIFVESATIFHVTAVQNMG